MLRRIVKFAFVAFVSTAAAQDISLDEDDGGISLGEKAEKKLSGEELAAKAKADKEARVIARLKASAAVENDQVKRGSSFSVENLSEASFSVSYAAVLMTSRIRSAALSEDESLIDL